MEVPRVEGHSVRRGQDQSAVLPGLPRIDLPLLDQILVRAQCVETDIRKRQDCVRRRGLRRTSEQLALDALELPPDVRLLLPEVDVRPAETEQLAAPQAEHEQQDVSGMERIAVSSEDSRNRRASSTVHTSLEEARGIGTRTRAATLRVMNSSRTA